MTTRRLQVAVAYWADVFAAKSGVFVRWCFHGNDDAGDVSTLGVGIAICEVRQADYVVENEEQTQQRYEHATLDGDKRVTDDQTASRDDC